MPASRVRNDPKYSLVASDCVQQLKLRHELRNGYLQMYADRKSSDALGNQLDLMQQEVFNHELQPHSNSSHQQIEHVIQKPSRRAINKAAAKRRAMLSLSRHKSEVASMAKEAMCRMGQNSTTSKARHARERKLSSHLDKLLRIDEQHGNGFAVNGAEIHERIQNRTNSDCKQRRKTTESLKSHTSSLFSHLKAFPRVQTAPATLSSRGKDRSQVVQDLLDSRQVRAEVRTRLMAQVLCTANPPSYSHRNTDRAYTRNGREVCINDTQLGNATRANTRDKTEFCPSVPQSTISSTTEISPELPPKSTERFLDLGTAGKQEPPTVILSSARLNSSIPGSSIRNGCKSASARPQSCRERPARGAVLYHAACTLNPQPSQAMPHPSAPQDASNCPLSRSQSCTMLRSPSTDSNSEASDRDGNGVPALDDVGPQRAGCEAGTGDAGGLPTSSHPPRFFSPDATITAMLFKDIGIGSSEVEFTTPRAWATDRHGGFSPYPCRTAGVFTPKTGDDERKVTGIRERCSEFVGLHMPSATEQRHLKMSILKDKVQQRCQSAARQRGKSDCLKTQMARFWKSLEGVKAEFRQPKNMRVAHMRSDLPEWERWRSMFLVPPKHFQLVNKPHSQ